MCTSRSTSTAPHFTFPTAAAFNNMAFNVYIETLTVFAQKGRAQQIDVIFPF